MVYITHVRFAGAATAENIVMLRWRQAIGDTNITDMIAWIESGGIARVQRAAQESEVEEEVKVVREPGRKPYLMTIAAGEPTNTIVQLPRF